MSAAVITAGCLAGCVANIYNCCVNILRVESPISIKYLNS